MNASANDLRMLRDYLLGAVDEATRERIEEALYPTGSTQEDGALAELLEVAEDALIDDYAFGRLSYADRMRLAQHFSWTMKRREKLAELESLTRRAEAQPAADVVAMPDAEWQTHAPAASAAVAGAPPARPRPAPFRLANLLPQPAFAAAASLLLIVAAYAAFQVGAGRAGGTALDPFVLGRDGGGTPELSIAAGAGVAPFVFDVGLQYPHYEVELQRLVGASYETVALRRLVTGTHGADTSTVGVSFDAGALATGTHVAFVRGVQADGTIEPLLRQSFTVTR